MVQQVGKGMHAAMHDACDLISQIVSKTKSQRFPQSYPPRICNQSWNRLRNKKVKNGHFAFLKVSNTKDPQTNTTKVVTMSFPSYHKKEFAMCWKKLHFSLPISPSKSIFQTIWTIFRGHHTLHGHTWVKCTDPSKTPTCTIQLSSNITKVTHLSSYALTKFSHYDTSNDPHFHLTLLHANPIHVTMPHWNFTNLVFIQSKSHASSQIMQISHWNNI